MLKNTQIKIILIFTILGVVIITGLGMFFSNNLENLNSRIKTEDNRSK